MNVHGSEDWKCRRGCARSERREVSFRAKRQIAALAFLAAMIGAGLMAMVIGGCTSPSGECGRPVHETSTGNQGRSWEVVFPTPDTACRLAGMDPRTWEEYSRNDAHLNVRPIQPLVATAQWPEPDRPSLAYARRVFIDTRADTLLYFQSRSDYYSPSYGPGLSPGGQPAFWPR